MSVADVVRSTMRGRSPPPIVPEMPTVESEPVAEGDGTRRTSSGVRSDGGAHRSLPERAFGAPLVPDCS
jgi:hypothetical protein